jgi:hypothetical protein
MESRDGLQLRPDVVATVLEDGAVLLDLRTKYFYSVNPSGWALVELFERGASADEAMTHAMAWGAKDEDRAALSTFLEVLVADELVVAAIGAPAAAPEPFEGEWSAPAIEKHREPLQRIMTSAFDPTLPLAE